MFGNKISSDNNLQTHWFNLSVECSELGYSETGKCFFLWGGGGGGVDSKISPGSFAYEGQIQKFGQFYNPNFFESR